MFSTEKQTRRDRVPNLVTLMHHARSKLANGEMIFQGMCMLKMGEEENVELCLKSERLMKLEHTRETDIVSLSKVSVGARLL